MKLFWRPTHVSTTLLVFVAGLAVGGYLLVESHRVERTMPDHDLKLKAAKVCKEAFEAVKQARLKRGLEIDLEDDPMQSGLIGTTKSGITSKTGDITAKHTSINPNWAAVFVAMFKNAKVQKGDTVAFGMTGSFPALNIAALAAAKVMNIRPIIVSSVSASMWGANLEKFTWLDMEAALREAGIFDAKSVGATLGGVEDRGIDITKRGIGLIRQAMQRNQVPELVGDSLDAMVDARKIAYKTAAEGQAIVAYVNIGGGIASVGSIKAKKHYRAGLNEKALDEDREGQMGVMQYFAEEGVPVLHIVRMRKLAQQYGLPFDPPTMSKPGEGGVFRAELHATWLIWTVLGSILGALFAITRIDVNFVLRKMFKPSGSAAPPGPAV